MKKIAIEKIVAEYFSDMTADECKEYFDINIEIVKSTLDAWRRLVCEDILAKPRNFLMANWTQKTVAEYVCEMTIDDYKELFNMGEEHSLGVWQALILKLKDALHGPKGFLMKYRKHYYHYRLNERNGEQEYYYDYLIKARSMEQAIKKAENHASQFYSDSDAEWDEYQGAYIFCGWLQAKIDILEETTKEKFIKDMLLRTTLTARPRHDNKKK